MDKIFCRTKVTKISNGDENFVDENFCPTKILSDELFRWYVVLEENKIKVKEV